MKKNNIGLDNKAKPASKTDWNKVLSQTNSEILRNAYSDPESPILSNKKYCKPEKIKV